MPLEESNKIKVKKIQQKKNFSLKSLLHHGVLAQNLPSDETSDLSGHQPWDHFIKEVTLPNLGKVSHKAGMLLGLTTIKVQQV